MAWEEFNLGELSTYRKGKIHSSELDEFNYVSTDSMLANRQGITQAVTIPENTNVNTFYKNDILISNIRPYFKKIWFADKSGGCSNDVLVFPTDNKRVVPEFLYYNLSSDYFFEYMVAASNGTKMPRGSKDSILKFIINLPPLETQQKIVNLISNYDDLIENNNKRIKLLESMAEELYKEWFVRLRFPNYQNTKIEDGIPQGWEEKIIAEVCSVSGGGTPSTKIESYWDNGTIDWYTPSDLTNKKSICSLNSENKISVQGLNSSSSKLLNQNSFMMTSRASIGIFAITNKEFCTNQGFINITPNKDFEKYYLLYNFKNRVDEFKMLGTGATFPEISKSVFNKIKIIMPIESLIKDFDKLIKPIIDELFNLEQKNQTLKQTRDLLLPRLLSGKLDIEKLDIN